MNLGQIQTKLGTLLKVKTKRYPLAERTDNINQAIRDLDDEFESWFSEYSTNWIVRASKGEYLLEFGFGEGIPEFSSPIDVYYLSSGGAEVPLAQLTIEEIVFKYPKETDEGAPLAFAIWEEKVYIRPVPDGFYTLYWKYLGKKRPLSEPGDSNSWTAQEPYAVLYTAAVYGCVHILEENRMGVFAALAKKKIDNISIRQSRRMSAARPVSEEPGATQGV